MNLINTRYSFISAYLKGEESRSVNSEQIGEMLQRSATMQDALEIIADTDIGTYLLDEPITSFDEADEYLWLYLGECMRRFESFDLPSDIRDIARLYKERFDVLNIRIALRAILKRTPSTMVPLGLIHDGGYLNQVASVREKEELFPILASCNLGDYIHTIESITEKDQLSISEGELSLQNLYTKKMLNSFRKMSDGPLLETAARINLDTNNLLTVFRVSLGGGSAAGAPVLMGGRMLSESDIQELLTLKMPEIVGKLENTGYHTMAQEVSKGYEKGGDITAIDRIMEKHRLGILKDLLSARILSTSNMLWYLFIKDLEIRNLRLVFKMLADGISPSDIRELVIAA